MTLLSVRDVYGGYGGVDILNGTSLDVEKGQIVVVIGPNGAGKSTLMKAIFGLVRIRAGSVELAGREITNAKPNDLVPLGVSYVPQERNIFASLSVQENLEMGAYTRRDAIADDIDRVYEIFPPLKERRRQTAGSMSGGQRQMVAIGRALMVQPQLLMLDEPTAGLSPKFIDLIFERIAAINGEGVGILMVEQNAKKALTMADQGYVLALGCNRHQDTGANLLADRDVARTFLGG
ncbi:MAG: ABC transporter ATP-binding protein [Alphaproteobacteria bacterium]|nr:ABC transporter ATP-binding protein [Alphaproteobacteria bacterium]MCZ6764919.1 ABC transporter ATP-binding protein [Alphaproteobacteria bacterium]